MRERPFGCAIFCIDLLGSAAVMRGVHTNLCIGELSGMLISIGHTCGHAAQPSMCIIICMSGALTDTCYARRVNQCKLKKAFYPASALRATCEVYTLPSKLPGFACSLLTVTQQLI